MQKLKRKKDWVGRYVRTKREMTTNGGRIFPVGTVMQVARNRGGLELEIPEMCLHCSTGYKYRITKVEEWNVELLPENFQPIKHDPVTQIKILDAMVILRDYRAANSLNDSRSHISPELIDFIRDAALEKAAKQ